MARRGAAAESVYKLIYVNSAGSVIVWGSHATGRTASSSDIHIMIDNSITQSQDSFRLSPCPIYCVGLGFYGWVKWNSVMRSL